MRWDGMGWNGIGVFRNQADEEGISYAIWERVVSLERFVTDRIGGLLIRLL